MTKKMKLIHIVYPGNQLFDYVEEKFEGLSSELPEGSELLSKRIEISIVDSENEDKNDKQRT